MIETNSAATTLTLVSDREVIITRVFDAPRKLVFEALTKPEHLVHWWGLRSHTMVVCEVDLRVGGAWRYVLRAPDGSEYGFHGEYREIVPPEKLVSTEEFEGIPPGHDYLATVTLDEQDGRTIFTNRLLYKSVEDRDGHLGSGMEAGMRETFDRLDEHLAKQRASSGRAIIITRIFDAPRELVWQAWTDPEHLMRWWGPKIFTSPVCKVDLRVGGKYLFCMRSPEGQDFWSTGVYREIVPLERIVCTDSFADEHGNVVPASHYGMDGDIPLEMMLTVTFEAHEGKTKMTLTHVGLPAGEMENMASAGWNESLDKLAASLR